VTAASFKIWHTFAKTVKKVLVMVGKALITEELRVDVGKRGLRLQAEPLNQIYKKWKE
jgi:hypothetical protein